MKYPPHLLDEIRARLPVSEVVGRRVRLKRQGREFAGLSPFNPEKTPSFFVNDQKGFYHCFSSGKHGDVFRFLMETEGLSFPEAVERLAAETGVTLPKPDAREEKRERLRASLADVCEMAARFFEENLKLSTGASARAYVEKRRLEARTVREFRVGYAPAEREALKRHLLGKGVDEQAMVDAGLLIKPDDGRASYDRFRNRLMIPIQDERGRVVAFGGRALSSEDNPKYLNSPETELFHKGFMLFNGHRARAAAYDQGSVIVVEGYLDAIAVWQAGIPAVVATLGTAFTEEQIQRMWRFAAEPLVCFDGDRAGVKAAHRAIDRILPHLKSGFSFNFVFLPDGKDPDELIQGGGADAFRAEVARAVPLADVLWDRETQGTAIDTPERKAALEKRLEDLVHEIKDARVQRAYQLRFRLKLSNLFWTSERGEGRNLRSRALPTTAPITTKPRDVSERILLGLSVDRPDQFEKLYDGILDHVRFNNDLHRLFWDELYRVVISTDVTTALDVYRQISDGFYMIFNSVYGIEKAESRITRAWGYNLRAAVPILNFHPSESFVEDLLVHQADWLLLMQAEDELRDEFLAAGDDVTEEEYDRLIGMRTDLMRRREEFVRRDSDIAEMAKSIRRSFGELGQAAVWRKMIAEMVGRQI